MAEPSNIASGTKIAPEVNAEWVAMLLEIQQAMLASPASGDIEAAGVDRHSYAIWKFAQHAAAFYHQAEAEGRLKEYFKCIDKISRDRWPTLDEDALRKVGSFAFTARLLPMLWIGANRSYGCCNRYQP
jgi:hypothetical protein